MGERQRIENGGNSDGHYWMDETNEDVIWWKGYYYEQGLVFGNMGAYSRGNLVPWFIHATWPYDSSRSSGGGGGGGGRTRRGVGKKVAIVAILNEQLTFKWPY